MASGKSTDLFARALERDAVPHTNTTQVVACATPVHSSNVPSSREAPTFLQTLGPIFSKRSGCIAPLSTNICLRMCEIAFVLTSLEDWQRSPRSVGITWLYLIITAWLTIPRGFVHSKLVAEMA